MKCLHICNDFMGSKVHENLYKNLYEQNVNQTIFYPLRRNKISDLKNYQKKFDCTIISSKPLKSYYKILFRSKIKFLYKSIESNIEVDKFDIVHATTLFSDGALALKIKKKYDIPYIVAVRETDIGSFLKYRPDLFFLLKEILNNASKVIFISSALKNSFLSNIYVQLTGIDIRSKCEVIYNGIDDFWISNISIQNLLIRPNKILYIGSFVKRKNSVNLIKAILHLKKSYPDLKIDLVGIRGEDHRKVLELSKLHPDSITYHGGINDKNQLRRLYLSNHIFAMPSFAETFGLVYLEALSQGLPVLCSRNQGIDGVFKYKIGEFVNPNSIDSISEGIENMIKNYSEYEVSKINFTDFLWKKISTSYYNLYNSIIKN